MSRKKYQHYTKEFRREAVNRAGQPGNTAASVAKELGKFRPVSGSIVGLLLILKSAALAPGLLLFVASASILALYLVYYHLLKDHSTPTIALRVK